MAKTLIEEARILNDYIKHLNTLSTGSILLLITFLDKLVAKPGWTWLIGAALISFLVSVIGGIIVKTIVTLVAYSGQDEDDVSDTENHFRFVGIILLWLGFLVGVICVAVFGIKNL